MPNIISIASTRRTNAPATAKDDISTPNRPSIACPTKRKATKMANEINAALIGLKLFFFSFIPIMIGTEPKMSITANITMNALKISLMLKFILLKIINKVISPSFLAIIYLIVTYKYIIKFNNIVSSYISYTYQKRRR